MTTQHRLACAVHSDVAQSARLHARGAQAIAKQPALTGPVRGSQATGAAVLIDSSACNLDEGSSACGC